MRSLMAEFLGFVALSLSVSPSTPHSGAAGVTSTTVSSQGAFPPVYRVL